MTPPTQAPLPNALLALAHWAQTRPQAIAIRTETREVSYGELQLLVTDAAAALSTTACQRCAFFMDNGLAWIIADLAARRLGCVVVPVPGYFSDSQIDHILRRAGVDLIITDAPRRLAELCQTQPHATDLFLGAGPDLHKVSLLHLAPVTAALKPALPPLARKLTFTSGTTGQPKGVCLPDAAIDQVAQSILTATEGSSDDRHLSVLPYAALLENIAAIDVSILAGAEICALPLTTIGFTGSSGLQPMQLIATLDRFRPTSIVTVPQILQVLVEVARKSGWRPTYLRHVAVGGAAMPQGAVQAARDLGLPVFEGYGLSECGSVVALNTQKHNRPGSVGRPLPHCVVTLAEDGEVMVSGARATGYLDTDDGVSALPAGPLATGDIGRFDADGYLFLLGRKKNMFITAFGRNVAPDWVECELITAPAIAQAAVFGEARPWNVAVIVPRAELVAKRGMHWQDQVSAEIDGINARLPDYARIRRWLAADHPFLPGNGLLTWNGRLRRQQIGAVYHDRIERLYQEDSAHVL